MEGLQQMHKEKVLKKIDEMQRYVKELEEITPSEEEYKKTLVEKRACEKTVELAIECVIDICAILVTALKAGVPSDEDDIFAILKKKKVFSEELLKILSEMKGFRNILVHKYGIVDDALVYEYLTQNVGDFERFENEVRTVFKNGKK